MSLCGKVGADEKDPEKIVLYSRTEPVYFSGDTISYNRQTGIVTGEGNVEIVQDGNKLQGENATINVPRELAEIKGNVIASGETGVVEGTEGVYDFGTREGVFYDARSFNDPWYISADEIHRSSTGAYSVANASITTCAEPKPHYRLKAGEVTVVPRERITARKLTLFAGPIPIFYFPYYSQSFGSRVPPISVEAGTQSDLGQFIGLGYTLEPTEGISLTPAIRAYTKSGVGAGLDGRLSLFEGAGQGFFDTFYIYDLDPGTTDGEKIDPNRGSAYAYYRQSLGGEWEAVVRAEYNSDSEFLKTFAFSKYQDLEPPHSYVNLVRTGTHDVVSLLARVRLVDYIEDVERIPQLRTELLEQRLADTDFFFSAGNEIAYLNLDPGDANTTRNFSYVRLAYPLRLREQLEVIPFVEADGTYYSDTLEQDGEYRLSASSGVTAQTELQRTFGSPFSMYSGFRHVLVPSITYRYRPTPNVEPSELQQFDEIDQIDQENQVEIEIINYLQAKKPDGTRRQLAQYSVEALLDFDDPNTLTELENELWIVPTPRWEFALKSFNDFREETRSDLLSAVVKYSIADSFEAFAGVIHGDTELSPSDTQVVYSFSKAFGPFWRAGFEQRYDFAESKLTYQEYWLWHSFDCLEALLTVRDRQEATSVMVLVNITAFPMSRIERQIAIKPIEVNRPWPTFW